MIHGAKLWANSGRHVNREGDINAIRADLKAIFSTLGHFEPLIRSGIVVMRSQFPVLGRERYALDSSVRNDLRSDSMVELVARQEGVPLPRWITSAASTPLRWRSAEYRRSQTLEARVLLSRENTSVQRLFRRSIRTRKRQRTGTPPSKKRNVLPRRSGLLASSRPLIEEVLHQVAPDLTLDPGTAVKVRASEEAFIWRIELRELQRASAGLSDEEIPQLVSDRMQPRIDEVRKAVSKSDVLKLNAQKNLGLALIAGSPRFRRAWRARSLGSRNYRSGWKLDGHVRPSPSRWQQARDRCTASPKLGRASCRRRYWHYRKNVRSKQRCIRRRPRTRRQRSNLPQHGHCRGLVAGVLAARLKGPPVLESGNPRAVGSRPGSCGSAPGTDPVRNALDMDHEHPGDPRRPCPPPARGTASPAGVPLGSLGLGAGRP